MKKTSIAIIVILILIIGGYYLLKGSPKVTEQKPATTNEQTATTTTTTQPVVKTGNGDQTVIGKSVQGRDIVAYQYGTGDKELLFVGGIHGGYEWNTSLVSFQLMDYLKANVSKIPSDMHVTVIPVLNPDGLYSVVGTTTEFAPSDVSKTTAVVEAGRFNANNVDLNRNFECDWQANAKWQDKTVSGGSSVFSEPEAQAMKMYVEGSKPVGVVVWYSAAGGVFASSCHNGVLPETTTLTSTFAKASGYPAYKSFDFYATTGDMVNWLAKNNIPAISVLLTNHTDTEWAKNKAGVDALLTYFKNK